MANSFKVGLSKSIPLFSEVKHSRFFNVNRNFDLLPKTAAVDKYLRGFFLVWIIPLLLITVFTLLNYSGLPKEIPLFYSRVWGEAQLTGKSLIFLPIGGIFLLGIFNLSLAANFHEHDRVLSYFFSRLRRTNLGTWYDYHF